MLLDTLFSVLAVIAAIAVAWTLVGVVLVLAGHIGTRSWDPSARHWRTNRPRLSALSQAGLIVGLLLLMPSTTPGSPITFVRLGLGLVVMAAAIVTDLFWVQTPPHDRPYPQWSLDPTGETGLEWFWDGRAWTERRREPRGRGSGVPPSEPDHA